LQQAHRDWVDEALGGKGGVREATWSAVAVGSLMASYGAIALRRIDVVSSASQIWHWQPIAKRFSSQAQNIRDEQTKEEKLCRLRKQY
jgi:hypothetical protein